MNSNLISFNSSKSLEDEIKEGINKIKEKFEKMDREKLNSLESENTISPVQIKNR